VGSVLCPIPNFQSLDGLHKVLSLLEEFHLPLLKKWILSVFLFSWLHGTFASGRGLLVLGLGMPVRRPRASISKLLLSKMPH
jgi:hypothetical protein